MERGGDKEKGDGGRSGGGEGEEGGGDQGIGEDGYDEHTNDLGEGEGEEEEEEEGEVRGDSSDGEIVGKAAVRKYQQFNIECGGK